HLIHGGASSPLRVAPRRGLARGRPPANMAFQRGPRSLPLNVPFRQQIKAQLDQRQVRCRADGVFNPRLIDHGARLSPNAPWTAGPRGLGPGSAAWGDIAGGTAAGTGDRVSVSIMHKAFEGCKAVERYAGGQGYKAVGDEEAVRGNDVAPGPDAA